MNIKKVFAIILVIILILLLGFSTHIVRNYIIMSDIKDKLSNQMNKSNYHILVSNDGSNGISEMEIYEKDGKKLNVFYNDNNVKMSVYSDGEIIDMFTETETSKTSKHNTQFKMNDIEIVDLFGIQNTKFKLSNLIATTIKTEKYNEKMCYVIKYKLDKEQRIVYIEKETGLGLRKVINDKVVSEIECEFNNVDDSIFIEPEY